MLLGKNIINHSRVITLLCFFYCSIINAQINLIPNPSFEDTIAVPRGFSEINKCKDWYSSSNRTPDYFSVFSPTNPPFPQASVQIPKNCIGYQNARTGNFYSGIIIRTFYPSSFGYPPYVNYTEYLSIILTNSLLANHSYSFTLYYCLANGSNFSTNQLSAYFSQSPFMPGMVTLIDTSEYFNSLPTQVNNTNFITDTLNWTPLTGCFIAQGGEKHLTIGNFKDAIHSPIMAMTSNPTACTAWGTQMNCYIYIDDVSLYDMGLYLPASAKNDTLVCNGTALNISSNITKDSSLVAWSPPTALSCTNCPNPIATPTTTTLYYVNKSICGASSKDSILVTVHTPSTSLSPFNNETICLNETKQIGYKDSTNFTAYSWLPNYALSCNNCAAPYANPDITTTYTLTRTECSTSFNNTVTVNVDDCNPTYTVPNVFTPNYDDVNDTWGIKFTNTKYIKNFQMHIYDRWGLPVYSTNSALSTPNSRWDGHTSAGSECSEGVYFYVISFNKNEEHVELKGAVHLFR